MYYKTFNGFVDFTNFRLDLGFSMYRDFNRFEIEFVSKTGPFWFQFSNQKKFHDTILWLYVSN